LKNATHKATTVRRRRLISAIRTTMAMRTTTTLAIPTIMCVLDFKALNAMAKGIVEGVVVFPLGVNIKQTLDTSNGY